MALPHRSWCLLCLTVTTSAFIREAVAFFTSSPPPVHPHPLTSGPTSRTTVIVKGRYNIKPKWKKIQQGGGGPQTSTDWMEEEKRLEQQELMAYVEEEEEEGELQIFRVQKNEAGQRLDRFLTTRVPEQSRTYLTGLISRGLVKINGVAEAKSRRVLGGEEVRVQFVTTPEIHLEAEDIPLTILYEDEDIIGVYKPAAMVTHPAPGNWNGTIVNAVLGYLQRSSSSPSSSALEGVGSDSKRPGVVHRLDKGTSGILIMAKTPEAHAGLSDAFATRRVNKTYLAVTVGNPGTDVVIDNPIARHPVDRQRMTVHPLGKTAKSTVNSLAFDGKVAVVKVDIETGRTHQIRVHLVHRGTPVWGDATYGKSQWNKRLRDRYGIDRPLLHAHRIEVPHPTQPGKSVRLTAPLPGDFSRVLGAIYPQWRDEQQAWTLLEDEGQGDDPGAYMSDKDAEAGWEVEEVSSPKEEGANKTKDSSSSSSSPALMTDQMVQEVYGEEYLEYM